MEIGSLRGTVPHKVAVPLETGRPRGSPDLEEVGFLGYESRLSSEYQVAHEAVVSLALDHSYEVPVFDVEVLRLPVAFGKEEPSRQQSLLFFFRLLPP